MFWALPLTIVVLVGFALCKCFPMSSFLFRIGYALYSKTYLGYLYHLRKLSQYKATHDKPHSTVVPWLNRGLKIVPVPFLDDNYSYLVIDTEKNVAVVVDPSDPEAVKDALKKEKVKLEAVLTTHKHWDHSGGNSALKEDFPGIAIYGSAIDDAPSVTHPIKTNETTLQISSFSFTAILTPGHTTGHMVFLLDGSTFDAPDSLFSGDLLFLGGCGRIFEGKAKEMLQSLEKVSVLGDNTLLWPGHDYALKNLMFAITLEPENPHLRAKLDWVSEMTTDKHTTSPSTIGEEKLYNPFLRTHVTEVISAMGLDQLQDHDVTPRAVHVLAELRHRKNNFK